MLISSHACGAIQPSVPIYGHLTGTYTPTSTGNYKLDIQNTRSQVVANLQNYIDNITLVPLTTDFRCDTLQFSAAVTNEAKFVLNPGTSYTGYTYIVLLSVSGNWPGINNGGYWLPLNMDSVFDYSKVNYNGPVLINTLGQIGSNGKAYATLKTYNPMPTWIGRELSVGYLLFQGKPVPFQYASMPLTIYFIP